MRSGKIFYVNIIVTINDDGYLAECHGIQGAFAEGDTVEEAVFNCIDVIKMITDYRKERAETIGMHETDITSGMEISVQLPLSAGL